MADPGSSSFIFNPDLIHKTGFRLTTRFTGHEAHEKADMRLFRNGWHNLSKNERVNKFKVTVFNYFHTLEGFFSSSRFKIFKECGNEVHRLDGGEKKQAKHFGLGSEKLKSHSLILKQAGSRQTTNISGYWRPQRDRQTGIFIHRQTDRCKSDY